MSIKISASTNPPKLNELNDYIVKLDKEDIDYIHCDVMDGRFVKAKTFGPRKVAEINRLTEKTLDVHLMVKNPAHKIKKYVKAGADILTIHYESIKNKKKIVDILQNIKKLGAFAGLSFNPTTSVLEILPYIYFCDMLLVMSVIPGKSGQEFMPETLVRLDTINKFLKKQKMDVVLEVDGGVNDKNVSLLKEKNVDSVVLGNYLYTSGDLKNAISKIKTDEKKPEEIKENKAVKSKKEKPKKAKTKKATTKTKQPKKD